MISSFDGVDAPAMRIAPTPWLDLVSAYTRTGIDPKPVQRLLFDRCSSLRSVTQRGNTLLFVEISNLTRTPKERAAVVEIVEKEDRNQKDNKHK